MIILLEIIVFVIIIVVVVKLKIAKINSDLGCLHEFTGLPQPVILNDNRTKIAQIKFKYYINDKMKAYKAKRYNVNFAGVLELGGITYLRTALGDKEGKSFEEGFPEIENNIQNFLIEKAMELGLELTEVSIKVGEKEDFEFCDIIEDSFFGNKR